MRNTMGTLRYEGLYQPSGVSYLIAEGILSVTHTPDDYVRTQTRSNDQDVEEAIRVGPHIVWSRNGEIVRVFDLTVEDEKVSHALVAFFPPLTKSRTGIADLRHQNAPQLEPALVAILKTQLHIFMLSGGTHVVPLSFEIGSVLAGPVGILLQPMPGGQTYSTARKTSASRWEQIGCGTEKSACLFTSLLSSRFSNTSDNSNYLTYSLVDVLSDIGVVTAQHSRRASDADDLSLLPSSERLIYASCKDETFGRKSRSIYALNILVTQNLSTRHFTIWQIKFNEESVMQKRSTANIDSRKSEDAYMQRQSRASSGRATSLPSRDDRGGLSHAVGDMQHRSLEKQLTNMEELAAVAEHDFGLDVSLIRGARRISSLLARSELGSTQNHVAVNGAGAKIASRKSFSRSLRREASLGSFVEGRQSSAARRQTSRFALESTLSEALSFADPDERWLTGGVAIQGRMPDEDHHDLDSVLSKDLLAVKIKSVPMSDTGDNDSSADVKVFTLLHPNDYNKQSQPDAQMSVCILERASKKLTVITLLARSSDKSHEPGLKSIRVQIGTGVDDASLIAQQSIRRLLILTKTSQNEHILHLEAPWSISFRLDASNPHKLRKQSDVLTLKPNNSNDRPRQDNVLAELQILNLLSGTKSDECIVLDAKRQLHTIHIGLAVPCSLSTRILNVCQYVLPLQLNDSLLVADWEIRRWLGSQDFVPEWPIAAELMLLFSMAIPFISALQGRHTLSPRRRKTYSVKSAPTGEHNVTNVTKMLELEKKRRKLNCTSNAIHDRISSLSASLNEPNTPTKRRDDHIPGFGNPPGDNSVLLNIIDMTRDFLQSPAGESMIGTEGYSPIAVNQDRNVRKTSLASITVALYLLAEELKISATLGNTISAGTQLLTATVCQLGTWLGWQAWSAQLDSHPFTSEPPVQTFLFDKSRIDMLNTPPAPFVPISIWSFLESRLMGKQERFWNLSDILQDSSLLTAEHPMTRKCAELLPLSYLIIEVMPLNNDRLNLIKSITEITAAVSDVYDLTSCTATESKSEWTDTTGVHTAVSNSHSLGAAVFMTEDVVRWDVSAESKRRITTRFVFGKDRRYQEASNLVNQTRPPFVDYEAPPGQSEAEALESQKALAQHVCRRTFSVAAGRGMLHFNTHMPLLTEVVAVPRFSVQCYMMPYMSDEGAQPLPFSADRSLFTEDKVAWAFFHNGASTGLTIARDAKVVDTSWILYNKPAELTNRHAGMLLALGLNGHLTNLAKWVRFKYLTPKHTMTTIGCLIGMAASFRGTADALHTRIMSIHCACLLPPGASELNLGPTVQTAAIMGIGLLYQSTNHRRMSEVLLSEIECKDAEEHSGEDRPVLRDESYRLTAGFSLGLINLGRGDDIQSLHDMHVVDRLLMVAVSTKQASIVHVLDRAIAGAVMAVAMLYMKTNNRAIAGRIDVPSTPHQFDYVRPDIFLLRTLAKNMIMWDSIEPTQAFIRSSVPAQSRNRVNLTTCKKLASIDLPLFHILAGICFAIALRFAGSFRHDVRDLLIDYLDQFIRLAKTTAISYDAKITVTGIRNCLDILALSCAIVMAGSGDVVVFRRLRALHGRVDKDTPYGSHLACHMAVGALFLSGGTATFGTSKVAVASMMMAFYPLFPADVLDNKAHLQALRHMWVLAVEHRCLIVKSEGDGHVIGGVEVYLKMTDGSMQSRQTPCTIPDYDDILTITVRSGAYQPACVNLEDPVDARTGASGISLRQYYKSRNTGIEIIIRKQSLYDKPATSAFEAEVQAFESEDYASSLFGLDNIRTGKNTHNIRPVEKDTNPFSWILDLPAFKALNHTERALISDKGLQDAENLLQPNPADIHLDLDVGTLDQESLDTNKLWQIRLLLALADRINTEEDVKMRIGLEERLPIKMDTIEDLRLKLWNLSSRLRTTNSLRADREVSDKQI